MDYARALLVLSFAAGACSATPDAPGDAGTSGTSSGTSSGTTSGTGGVVTTSSSGTSGTTSSSSSGTCTWTTSAVSWDKQVSDSPWTPRSQVEGALGSYAGPIAMPSGSSTTLQAQLLRDAGGLPSYSYLNGCSDAVWKVSFTGTVKLSTADGSINENVPVTFDTPTGSSYDDYRTPPCVRADFARDAAGGTMQGSCETGTAKTQPYSFSLVSENQPSFTQQTLKVKVTFGCTTTGGGVQERTLLDATVPMQNVAAW